MAGWDEMRKHIETELQALPPAERAASISAMNHFENRAMQEIFKKVSSIPFVGQMFQDMIAKFAVKTYAAGYEAGRRDAGKGKK